MTRTPWDNSTNQELRKINESEIQIPKIAIGIPYNGSWYPEWTQKTYLPLISQPTTWCQKQVFLSRVPSISVARNSLVKQALDANCDYILFLDTDMIVEQPSHPNMALSALHSAMNKSKDKNSAGYKDGRIASALYRAKQKVGLNWASWMRVDHPTIPGKKAYSPIVEWTGNWLNVDVVGFGFCLVDMMVFRNISPPWFVWNLPNGISEDFWFCELAKEHGYNTNVLTDVRLSHIGILKVMSDGSITTQEM
jgi:glycosyltransferase involved in cell wall biosynthesis